MKILRVVPQVVAAEPGSELSSPILLLNAIKNTHQTDPDAKQIRDSTQRVGGVRKMPASRLKKLVERNQ